MLLFACCRFSPPPRASFGRWGEGRGRLFVGGGASSKRCEDEDQSHAGYQPPFALWTPFPSEIPAVDDWIKCSVKVWEQIHCNIEAALQHARHRGKTTHFNLETGFGSPLRTSVRGPLDEVLPDEAPLAPLEVEGTPSRCLTQNGNAPQPPRNVLHHRYTNH
ncbi:hypothetical protein MHYP_G00116820 [Metynnis hypsauchen]